MVAKNQAFLQALNQTVEGEVWTDKLSRGIYSTDASVYQIPPIAVFSPKHEEDVRAAVKLARAYGIQLLPRGGGTSLAGQTVGKSLILDFSRYMNQLLELNVEEKWAWVQPGMVRDELNALLASHHLHFAPDPATSSRANVGGMTGNNSSGTKSILYGKTVDHVLEIKAVLADGTELNTQSLSPEAYASKAAQQDREGEVYRKFHQLVEENRADIELVFPKVMRRVGGYNLDEFIHTDHWNLSKILVGSEGTLATSLAIKVNLEPLPAYKSVCVVHYSELSEAIRSVEQMLDFQPAAVEILDDTVVKLSRENLTTRRSCHFIEGNPAAILIVEFYGDNPETVMERPKRMIQQFQQEGIGYAYPLFSEGSDYEDVWIIRKKGLGLMLGIEGNKKPLAFIEDAGIPIAVLPEYIEEVLQVCKNHETEAAMYAHASVGVIHVRPILDLRDETDIERFQGIAEDTFQLVKKYGGSWSGEHGDGLVRSPFNEAFFGPKIYQTLKDVKHLFDPENRMNPGKIVDSPPMNESLRYGGKYKDNPVSTIFQYRKDQGFEESVHMCTGVGECRKMLGGTMCPSFKATRQEEHSTRGRANALRLAMSGQLSKDGLNDSRLHEALDLCLSCKACKSECPSNVDMAKLKSEVWQKKMDKEGVQLRDRLIRDSSKMAKRFSGMLAPMINRVQKTSVFRYVVEKQSGFDRRRVLPDYAPTSFASWFKQNYVAPTTSKGQVALFADTYLNYHEPQIGIAATKLLSACGYEVLLADVGCCQRPRISHGFLKLAKKAGTKMALLLDAYLRQEIPVLVCEPSCASALVDDLPDLIEDEVLSDKLSNGVKMLEVFLAEEIEKGEVSLSLKTSAPKILIHGHCHQKALFGTQAMKKLLALADDTEVSEIDSGCCGMAGSFGYEKEHYAISEKVGENVLFPAVRELADDTALIACGFSCRHQIEHFTEKKARHWVEWVEVS